MMKGKAIKSGTRMRSPENHARRNIDGEPIGEIVDRFEQELIDEPVSDLLAYFVVFVERRR